MPYLLDIPDLSRDVLYEESQRRHEAYRRYLESIRDRLPPSAYAFATTASFRTDASLHGAWVGTLAPHILDALRSIQPRTVREIGNVSREPS